jgi:Protein of unknown function (DUF3047)
VCGTSFSFFITSKEPNVLLIKLPSAPGESPWAPAMILTVALWLGGGQATCAQTETPGKFAVTFPQESISIKQWMDDHQWESKRHKPKHFEVGSGRMRLVSKGDSVMIGTTQGFPLDPKRWPRLRLRLRIIQNPPGTDNAKKSGDDSAFRLYVAFDRGKTLFGPPHTIVYLWTEQVDANTLIKSPYFAKNMRYLSIGKGTTASEATDVAGWITIERNLVADYRQVFPHDKEEVPVVGGILLKCDSNNTGTSAESWLASIEILALDK